MKEAIGGISLFQIAIVLILIFTGVMCLTMNHARAFGVKDEVITLIENNADSSIASGINDATAAAISKELSDAGYRITGSCPSGWTGYDRDGNENNRNASFCVIQRDAADALHEKTTSTCKSPCIPINVTEAFPKMYYYDIILFYQLDIPLLEDALNFKLYGSTKIMFG